LPNCSASPGPNAFWGDLMSEKIYAWLLKLYPTRFRDEYAGSALQLFRDRFRSERGLFRRLRFWLDIITDLAISLLRERWRREAFGSEMEGSFHISEEAVITLTKRAIASALFMSIFIAIGLTAGWLGNANHILLFAVYFALATIPIWQLLSVGRTEENWRNYELIFEAGRLRQTRRGNNVTILKSQIIKINEDQYGLRVFGFRGDSRATMAGQSVQRQSRERAPSIWIPVGLTGYQQVREQMFQWTDRIGRIRSPWLQDLRSAFFCSASLLPAMLLVHSTSWFLMIAAVYYGMVLFVITTDIFNPPPRSSTRLLRRLINLRRKPLFLVLLILPTLRIVLPH
jgi:hypothetical protein